MLRVFSLLTLSAGAMGMACEAGFVDLRPSEISHQTDAEAGEVQPGSTPDGDRGDEDASVGQARTVARGTWSGRSDYRASGTAELVLDASGSYRLEFSSDFSSSGVPGPVVVLSRRDVLGNRLDPSQDLELGALRSPTGGQSYDVPPGGDDRMWAWVFCKPFGVEVARARLEAVP